LARQIRILQQPSANGVTIAMNKSAILVGILSVVLLAGCTYYQTPSGTYTTTASVSKFDSSWSATVGAFADEGVRVTSEDRGAGVIQGTRNGIHVTGNVRQQADGSVRVQLDTSGDTSRDPGLIDRITRSYQRRMGR
jgi:hypothetical protein